MKKIFCFLFIFTVSLTVIGCQESAKKHTDDATNQKNTVNVNGGNGEKDMDRIDIYDFAFIKKAPESKEKQPLEKVIKVYFSEWSRSDTKIAIDVANNDLYINPRMDSLGLRFNEGTVKINDAENVINIFKKYNLQEWKRDYTFEDPASYRDGYSWSLWLQFENGTVEKHVGQGTDIDEITPKNFHEFAAELNRFVNERLEEK